MGRLAKKLLVVSVFSLLASGAGVLSAQAKPDNSKVNQEKSQPTADNQSNDSSDVKIAKEIRQSIVKDKSLSTYAHNIKIISQNGKVTLRGPVRSDDERSAIAAKASQIAGQGNVTDDMTVAPK